jgi:hypothetical protein
LSYMWSATTSKVLLACLDCGPSDNHVHLSALTRMLEAGLPTPTTSNVVLIHHVV